MSTKRKVLLVVAVLFTLLNLAGGVYAGVLGEVLHMLGHFALAVIGAMGVAVFAPRRRDAADRLPH